MAISAPFQNHTVYPSKYKTMPPRPTISTLLDNEDAVLQLLLRTNASDHEALRNTCKIFRRILDSANFRRERMQSEWAEVEVELLPPSEHYKREFPNSGGNKEDRDWSTIYNDIGFCPDGTDQFPAVITNVFRILVDQQPAGEGEFTLATRATNEFYEFCDYRGGNMAEVGALFFDHQGRAKTKSMQKALRKSDDRYFLFLESFQLHQDYRQHTWVGAKALQSFLTQSVVAEEWAVALFTPSSQSQFVGDDEQKYAAYQESIESGQRDDAWQQHMQDLLYLDMRQFIRAGFQKVTDVEHLTDEHYLFAVPSFLP